MVISYSFVPLDEVLWEIVLFCMVENVLNELWEDGFEFLQSRGLRHFDVNYL